MSHEAMTELLPGPEQRRLYQQRRCVVRFHPFYRYWQVSYYNRGHKIMTLDFVSHATALSQALHFVGLA